MQGAWNNMIFYKEMCLHNIMCLIFDSQSIFQCIRSTEGKRVIPPAQGHTRYDYWCRVCVFFRTLQLQIVLGRKILRGENLGTLKAPSQNETLLVQQTVYTNLTCQPPELWLLIVFSYKYIVLERKILRG